MNPTSPSAELQALVPPDVAWRYRVVPLALRDGTLEIAAAQTPATGYLKELGFLTGKKVVPVLRAASEIEAWLQGYGVSPAEIGLPDGAGETVVLPMTKQPAWGGPVTQQVDHLIHTAIDQQASDIHIEPYDGSLRVRYRLDGVLHHVTDLAYQQKDEIISRLKIMAGLDIAEKRRPQDGRIRISKEKRTIDIRVSTLPTDFGEKVVLRILDKSGLQLNLASLGFEDTHRSTLEEALRLPYGMILVTGPTGSGKTSTLYAALNALNTTEVNITTIEDPIEYNLPGINQAHVRSDIGFTFAQALRAFLRQDPDVIMVGEIRDVETAEISIRAALTGHLVLSTLHTNDAPSAITRLVDMGVESFLVAAAVRLVVAQRLVRRICVHCKQDVHADPALLDSLSLPKEIYHVHEGTGCAACNGTGYKGRTAVFEVMPVSETLADCIAGRGTTYTLRAHARSEGMATLREAALRKLYEGVTTVDEVLRETA